MDSSSDAEGPTATTTSGSDGTFTDDLTSRDHLATVQTDWVSKDRYRLTGVYEFDDRFDKGVLRDFTASDGASYEYRPSESGWYFEVPYEGRFFFNVFPFYEGSPYRSYAGTTNYEITFDFTRHDTTTDNAVPFLSTFLFGDNPDGSFTTFDNIEYYPFPAGDGHGIEVNHENGSDWNGNSWVDDGWAGDAVGQSATVEYDLIGSAEKFYYDGTNIDGGLIKREFTDGSRLQIIRHRIDTPSYGYQSGDVNRGYIDRVTTPYETWNVLNSTNVNPTNKVVEGAKLTATATVPDATSLTYYLSADGGTHWETVTPGQFHDFAHPGKDLRWQAAFETDSTIRTPVLENVQLDVETEPDVTIDTPENAAYNSSDVPLSVTADDEVATWSYSVDGGANRTFTPDATLSLPDGEHTVTVYAEDEYGLVGSASRSFSVDTDRPAVTDVTVEETPINDSVAGTATSVTVTFDEAMDTTDAPNVTISGLADSPLSVSGSYDGSQTWSGTVTVPDDDEEATATVVVADATDRAGNAISDFESGAFTVDTRAPTVTTTLDGRLLVDTVDLTQNVTSADDSDATAIYTYDDGSGETTIDTPENWDSTVAEDGEVTVEVELVDDAGNSDATSATVTIDNDPPAEVTVVSPVDRRYVNTTTDLPVVYRYTDATPNVTTADLTTEGSLATFQFDDSGYAGDGSNRSVVFDLSEPDSTAGGGLVDGTTYTLRIVAEDSLDQSAGTSVADVVTIDNSAPTPAAGNNRTVAAGRSVRFDATDSTDNVAIDTYEWQFGDGSTSSGATITHSYDSPGTYTVTLTTTDRAGNTATDRATITVKEPGEITYSNLSVTPNPTVVGESVRVNATTTNVGGLATAYNASLAVEGTVDTWHNGTLGAGESATVEFTLSFDSAGEYNVTVAGLPNATLTVGEDLNRTWDYGTDGRIQYAEPAVGPDRVFVGGLDATFHALYRSNGTADWSFERSGSLADSSPAYDGGTVYVGSGGGVVYALNATGGSVEWTHTTDSAVVSSPVVVNGTVFVGSNDGTVLALSAAEGTVEWRYETGGAVYSTVEVADDIAYVTTNDGRVIALDAANGSRIWTHDTGTELGHSSPIADGDSVYVAAGQLYALDAATGDSVWQVGDGGTAGSTPVVDAGTVYVGSADGVVSAVNTTDRSVVWTADLGAAVASKPAVVGNRVIVTSTDGDVSVLDAGDGETVTEATLSGDIRSSPVVVEEVVYVGSRDGRVVALANV